MEKKKLYKYINLLFRIIIAVFSVWFIYYKIRYELFDDTYFFDLGNINFEFIFIVFLLMFMNWGIESYKWRYTVRNIHTISWYRSFKLILTGITIGLLTPNRFGEIPARALLLDKNNFKNLMLRTTVSSFSQVLITVFLGVIGLCFNRGNFGFTISPILMVSGALVVLTFTSFFYFRIDKFWFIFNKIGYFKKRNVFEALSTFNITELWFILLLSLLRYIIFWVQYYLMLKAFGMDLICIEQLFLIPVCFIFTSFIPTILISEIGVRGSVALFIFGSLFHTDIDILSASIILWLINVAFPALIGVFNLKELKVLKEQ